ncbi:MAG: gamma-glutamylcyclotransferase [Rhizobiaceae bacterium]|nr:gamma-glutamylcyclotransferase [Rhizobiaceae bacterium]
MGDFWVFGYGSLMWKPGFPFAEEAHAKIHGLHRALCIYSWKHRGTEEQPGLVFGLDHGGFCQGVAFRIEEHDRKEVHAYLRERELITHVYTEMWHDIELSDGREVSSLVYVVDQTHPQYAGVLSHDEQLRLISSATGMSGNNVDYVVNTVQQLQAHNVRDEALERLRDALLLDD